MKKFSTPELVLMAALAAVGFVIGYVVVPLAGIVTGTLGGVVNQFFAIFFLVLVRKLVDKFPAATISTFLYGVLSIPTVLVLPQPGVHKLLVIFAIGLTGDLVMSAIKNDRLRCLLGGGLSITAGWCVAIPLIILLGIPLQRGMGPQIIVVLLLIAFVVGSISGLLAKFVYDRIKDTSFVKTLKTYK